MHYCSSHLCLMEISHYSPSHYSTMKYAKYLRKMNFLNSPSVKTGARGAVRVLLSPNPPLPSPPPSLSCFGDLPWPSTGRIFRCRSVAVTHVMCWRGWRRKQGRREGVILVRSPVGVGVRPGVKGWACLAQNTDCTSSANLRTKTPLGWKTGGGGVEGLTAWTEKVQSGL